jgi:hypothetical protein
LADWTKVESALMSPVLNGALVVTAASLAAVAGLELVWRLVPTETRQKHNDVAGFIYAALGVIYAVLLEKSC